MIKEVLARLIRAVRRAWSVERGDRRHRAAALMLAAVVGTALIATATILLPSAFPGSVSRQSRTSGPSPAAASLPSASPGYRPGSRGSGRIDALRRQALHAWEAPATLTGSPASLLAGFTGAHEHTTSASAQIHKPGLLPASTALDEVTPISERDSVARERAHQSGVSLTPSNTRPYWACPQGVCEAIVDPPAVKVGGHWQLPAGVRALEGSGEKGGYDPKDLSSAYDIPASGGERQRHDEEEHTIALVDVGYDATAESDLEEYRKQYELDPCTEASGCFRQVNEHGEADNPPPRDEEWELESSLDLDMASAACPHCHILLVEASEESLASLAESANTAANLGATEISNSYGLPELSEACGKAHCTQLDSDYDHPGVVVTASAGDAGYDNYLRGGGSPSFPAVSPYVIAVGGTSLHRIEATKGRKWSETVWWEPETRSLGTGSGCSGTEPKPTWQTDGGCAGRTDNDMAAVGACETPVSIYSTHYGGWEDVCGTSVSSPLVAGIEAHAGEAGGVAVPTADAFYQDRSSLYDVTKGRDGTCSPKYLCSAETQTAGYDGPAGNGTPDQGPVAVAGEPPSARSEPPGNGGTLNGVVDPNGLETTYCFEYGTTISYGTCTPAGEASAGSGSDAKKVSRALAGVPPAVYHYRLVATNRDGRSFGEDQIVDTAPPTVSGVAPDTGWTIGGARVKITGANFVGVTAVKFGSAEATSFKVLSDTSIEAESPAGTGTVDVTVESPGGTSAAGEADQFSYSALPPPTVTGLAPAAGLPGGGSEVTIIGADFAGVTAVAFGATPATSFEVLSETEIEAISPAGTGTVDVIVTTPGGTSATGPSDKFTYEAELAGGEPVWLAPTNLAAGIPHVAFPGPAVAIDRHGDAAAVWSDCAAECDGENGFVEAAFRPAGGGWSAPARLSGMSAVYSQSQIAFDQRGDAVAVFAVYSYPGTREIPADDEVVEAAVRPAGGSWQKAVNLSSGCEISGFSLNPHLAVDANGDAVANWRCHTAGTKQILAQAAYMPAGGGWQAPVNLAEAIEEGGKETLSSPNVVLDSQGNGFAGWSYNGTSEAAYRPAGDSWQTSTDIAEGGGTPELAVDGQGDAYALVDQNEQLAIAERPSGSGWQAPVEIAPKDSEGGPYQPELAVDSQGEAVVIWWQDDGQYADVHAARKPAGAGGWQTPITLSRGCAAFDFCLPEPQVTFDERGDAVAIWQHQGSERLVTQAARLSAGTWHGPVEIPGTEEAWDARLALDAYGNGVAVWEGASTGESASDWTVQAATYTVAQPTITKVEPDSGPASGGTAVTITGERLDATAVDFGSTNATSFETGSETKITAVAPPGTGIVDVSVTTPEGTSAPSAADQFTYQAAPTVLTGAASSPAQSSATLNATVDPEGLAVSDCHFEYGSSISFGSSAPCSALPGSGTSPVAVSAPLSGLSSYTTYYFRIVATNPDGRSYGAAQTFKTLPNPPTVVTDAASSVAQTTATLNASVNSNEEAVSDCHFEYGISPSVGSSVPCIALPSSIESPEPVSASVTGLSPNITYYFRIVAGNAGGASYGSVQTLKTASPELPEIGRCLKLGTATGKYESAACATMSAGADTGRYEWQPWPAAKNRFSSKGAAVTLETVGDASVKCHESRLAGEYTGSQTASVSLAFVGCEASGVLAGPCQSEGAKAGEIKTGALEGRLGTVKAGTKPSVGWELTAVAQPDLATFKCGARTVSIVGSVIAAITKLDKMSVTFTLKYTAKRGKQVPESFEAGVKDTLSFITEGAEEQAGLAMTDTISGEEGLEIKAIA